ncbi:phage tail spike protein [Staphylococcus simulans]|uniref:phage tail spike protein n=1 Tax=Staphylococcus simulans TaxID=1286 RepID=UPI003F7F3485
MIHVLDYKGNIIDFISKDDNTIIKATHHRNINERTETFDFTILSERAENMQDRNRIIIQDSNEQYREFIIEHISQDMDGYTEIETSASYLEDISNSVPYPPGKLTSMTTSQALRDVLKDTGWQVSDRTEYGGIRSTSWTSFQTRYEVLMQLCTTYSMIPDFYIEIGTNKVEGRYVVLKKRNAIFNGKEIVYGKDLLEMKRTVDMTEIKTALLASGPQKEDGTPGITLTVKDDEANNRYSLPGRYLWGIYSPESSDENMTESRLRTLATTELNKRKAAAISYEVKATDIKRYYPHEVIRLGDKIRIKNEDFVPSLYLEAEVIGEDYDLISGDSEYSFGEYKEYAESELKKAFEQRLRDIQQKLNDKVSNINTIIQQTQAGNLEYFEKKIIKSSTPPPNPVNDMLWYDTSNPSVAVVRRYWNGEWLESTVEDVEQIGGITREKALFSELENTFVNLSIQHSRLLSDVYDVINSEYFVDSELKSQVQNDLDNTVSIFNQIKNNLDSMTPETATIGKLVDTQALFLQYRESMQTLYRSVETAKLSIDERFKLLQSQYTDEKFNDAMSKVADTIGGTWNAETGQLLADIPSQKELEDALKTYINGQDEALKSLISGEVDSKLTQTKNELSNSINEVSTKVDGIKVGGRNLLVGIGDVTVEEGKKRINDKFISVNNTDDYVLSFTADMIENVKNEPPHDIIVSYVLLDNTGTKSEHFTRKIDITPYLDDVEVHKRLSLVIKTGNYSFLDELYVDVSQLNGAYASLHDFQLEQGNIPTAYNKAPEDTEELITTVKTSLNSDIKQLKDSVTLKADKSEVTTLYDDSIRPLERRVNDNSAELKIQSDRIDSKVSNEQYTADVNNVISKLNTAESQRTQLSNEINDRVTINEFNSLKVGTRNLLLNSKSRNDGVGTPKYRYVRYQLTEPLEVGETYTLSFYNRVLKGDNHGKTSIMGLTDNTTRFTIDVNNDDITTFTFKADGASKYLLIYNAVAGTEDNDLTEIEVTNAILVKGSHVGDYSVAPEENEQTLNTMQTQINQNGTDINQRATKEEFNASRKTLSKVVSDLTVNTTTGLTLSYDENGNIQSHTVGPDGVKIKGDRVNITVNEDFRVMTSAVNNKVGKNEVINSINVSNEGINIDANKVGIRGGDGTTYLDIQNTKILSRGFFDRTWGDVTDRPYCKLGIYDGHLIMQNETTGRNLYLTEKGLSTTMAGNLKGTSGTLEFHFLDPTDNTEGVRLHSYYGMVYLQSQENCVYIRSKQTTNIETADAGVYLRPYTLTRPGVNEFSYKVIEADNAADTDGYFIYGEVSNPEGLAGSGIRFRKKGYKGQTTGDYEPMIYATDNAGNANTGSFSARNFYGDLKTRLKHLYIMADSNGGEIRATSTTGYNSGNTTYLPVRAAGIKTHSALAFTNHANSDVFFGIMPGKTLCVTDVNGYNGGKPAYQSVRAKEYLPGSLEEYKRDIKEWNDDALSTISNAQLYQYNYKNDLDNEKTRHGFVIGDDYATPNDFIDGDGVKTYEMIAYCMRAIQQLNEKLEEYKNGK